LTHFILLDEDCSQTKNMRYDYEYITYVNSSGLLMNTSNVAHKGRLYHIVHEKTVHTKVVFYYVISYRIDRTE